VSWFEAVPTLSLVEIDAALGEGATSVVDVGGGASRLVDHLVIRHLTRLAVLDISGRALGIARNRLGDAARGVEWIEADVTNAGDIGQFDVWHDRAVFHFLTDPADRARYVAQCERTVSRGGIAVVATFAPDGPDMCSGLPVMRYDAADLAAACGVGFELIRSERFVHTTPSGTHQPFVYASFRRLAGHREPQPVR
jgi:SAM-dependent methyltransferase